MHLKYKKTPLPSKMNPLYIINKKNNWHCQRQKTLRTLLASDIVSCIHSVISLCEYSGSLL